MHADRDIGRLGGFEHRPVATVTERLRRERGRSDLYEMRVAGAPFDLGGGSFREILRHVDRGFQPRFRLGPRVQLPIVDRRAQRRAEIEVALIIAADTQRVQDAVGDVVGVEMLLAHEVEIGRGRAAVWRPGVASCRRRLHAWIGQVGRKPLAHQAAVRVVVLPPALRHERLQIRLRLDRRVNVAIDDAELGRRAVVGEVAFAGVHVHRAISCSLARTGSCSRA